MSNGVASAIANVSVSESGAIAGETFTVVLGDSYGLLSATGAGVSGAGTTQLVVTGSLAQVNAALGTLTDTDSVVADDTITLNITDSLGNTGAPATIEVATPTGTPYVWDRASGIWNVDSGGDWNPPGNGTTPTATSAVSIGSGPGGTVTMEQDEAVESLAITSGYTLQGSSYTATTVGNASIASGGAATLGGFTVGGALFVAGGLTLLGTLTAAGGVTAAAGGVVSLTGGELLDSVIGGAGAYTTPSNYAGTLDGVTISAGTTFTASDGANTNIAGAMVDNGAINLTGGADANGDILVAQATTLSGSGVLTMSAHPDDSGYGGDAYLEGAGQTLTLASGTIEGTGIIGASSLALVNGGVIDATPEGGTATLTIDNSGGIVNCTAPSSGVLEATAGGVLALESVTVNNVGGEILVGDASSTVQLENTTIQGGLLENTAGGALEVVTAATLDGSTVSGAVTIEGVFTASDNATTDIAGAIVNDGMIEVVGGADANGVLNLSGDVTLSGSGAIVLDSQPDNSGYGGVAYLLGADETLTIASGAIMGTGVIGADNLAIVNGGIIDATPEGGTTTLTLDNTGGVVNAVGTSGGLLEATGGGTLAIEAITVNNAHGVITVGDSKSIVELAGGATVQGGTLNNTLGGTLETSGAATLDGSTAAGAVTIEGVYEGSSGATTVLAGSIVNNGAIDIFGGADVDGELAVAANGAATLTGGGSVVLINSADNSGYGGEANLQGAGSTLTNVDNTIVGTGLIASDTFTLVNAGVIAANPESNTLTLTINSIGSLVNAYDGVGGTLEAMGGATLLIEGFTLDNAGGVIEVADSSSTVTLTNATIQGGALVNTALGTMDTSGNTTLDGNADGPLTIHGSLASSGGATTNITGSIVNDGVIDVIGGADQNGILNLTGPTTLSGHGEVVLINSADGSGYGGAASLQGTGETLTNADDTILGTGFIGGDTLAIINGGVIEAKPESDTTILTLENSGGIVNSLGAASGLIEAAGGGALVIDATIVDNANGAITVGDFTSIVELTGGATVQGGTLNNTLGGVMETVGAATLDGGTAAGAVTINGVFDVNGGAATTLAGSIVDKGAIDVFGGGDVNGELAVVSDGAATLTGGGSIVMINTLDGSGYSGEASLQGYGSTFTNVDDTIVGTGFITSDTFAFINGGVIAASPESNTVTLALDALGSFVNAYNGVGGTLEAMGGATLLIEGFTLNNAGGVIEVADSASTVQLTNATIQGGELTIAALGTMDTSGTTTLDGSAEGALTIHGNFIASNGATTDITGSIVNDGTIELNGGDDQNGIISLTGPTTLTGGGEIVMIDGADGSGHGGAAYLQGYGQTLTNVDNTILGAEIIGGDILAIVNGAVIEAKPESNTTILTLDSASGFVNADAGVGGTLEAVGGATLSIGAITVDNDLGVIKTADSASIVQLDGATIQGGVLNNSAGGTFETFASATLDGSTAAGPLTIVGDYIASDNATTEIAGTIIVDGAIDVGGGADSNGVLFVSTAATLTGGGTVTLSAQPDGSGYSGDAFLEGYGATLTNVDDTIQGTGVIGSDQLEVVNGSVIDATPEGGTSTLTIEDTREFLNANGEAGGRLEASAGGTLNIDGVTIDDALGLITVADASSVVELTNATIQGGTLSNLAGGAMETAGASTLDGGTAAGPSDHSRRLHRQRRLAGASGGIDRDPGRDRSARRRRQRRLRHSRGEHDPDRRRRDRAEGRAGWFRFWRRRLSRGRRTDADQCRRRHRGHGNHRRRRPFLAQRRRDRRDPGGRLQRLGDQPDRGARQRQRRRGRIVGGDRRRGIVVHRRRRQQRGRRRFRRRRRELDRVGRLDHSGRPADGRGALGRRRRQARGDGKLDPRWEHGGGRRHCRGRVHRRGQRQHIARRFDRQRGHDRTAGRKRSDGKPDSLGQRNVDRRRRAPDDQPNRRVRLRRLREPARRRRDVDQRRQFHRGNRLHRPWQSRGHQRRRDRRDPRGRQHRTDAQRHGGNAQ